MKNPFGKEKKLPDTDLVGKMQAGESFNTQDLVELKTLLNGAGPAYNKYMYVDTDEDGTASVYCHVDRLRDDLEEAWHDPLLRQAGKLDRHHINTAKKLSGKDIHMPFKKVWQAIALQRLVHTSALTQAYRTAEQWVELNNEGLEHGKDALGKHEKFQAEIDERFAGAMSTLDDMVNTKVFKWSDHTYNTAMKMPLPEHTISRELMPLDSMFVVFEKPVYFNDPMAQDSRRYGTFMTINLRKHTHSKASNRPDTERIEWTIDSKNLNNYRNLVNVGPDGANEAGCLCATDDSQGLPSQSEYDKSLSEEFLAVQDTECKFHGDERIVGGSIDIGAEYPLVVPDYVPDVFRECHSLMSDTAIKLLTFINTKATTVESEGVDRATRKRAKREGNNTEYPNVNVVNLRRYEYQGKELSSDITHGDGSRKQATRGHWVTGFYRSQAYGIGNSRRKVIFIEPFLRGDPENMVEEKVYSVSR